MLLTTVKQSLEKLDFWTVAGIVLGSLATYKMIASLCHRSAGSSSRGDSAGDGASHAARNAGGGYKAPPKPNPCPRDFTLKELCQFNGNQKPPVAKMAEAPASEASAGGHTSEPRDAASVSATAAAAVGALPPIYLALKGRVYDVTSHRDGRRFYAPDGPYGVFAGSDVTMNLAKMVFEESEKNQVRAIKVADSFLSRAADRGRLGGALPSQIRSCRICGVWSAIRGCIAPGNVSPRERESGTASLNPNAHLVLCRLRASLLRPESVVPPAGSVCAKEGKYVGWDVNTSLVLGGGLSLCFRWERWLSTIGGLVNSVFS
uniref:Cytochrome b5 heme-binding domain-containing protein n=1 Tax=Neospora caninum (strain Liverpool) TaxID=572307 RepID=F0JAW5_NEOCL|nr:hypothetical protein NCLIV_068950 [Neospora caninum Liverpool]CEL71231.1 TPA: hypothetical protein BN1204_068950 [Neospora caninum Liverpool]